MDNDTVTIVERYSTSINASNLRDEADKHSPTDILKAMAWTQSQIGAQLIRLQAEYDGVEHPRPLSHGELVNLALTMHSDEKEPKDRVKDKQIKAQIEAAKWMRNEKTLFMGKLKTLPSTIDAIGVLCERARIPNPRRVASTLVGFWLNQLCTVCNGLKAAVMPDTPTLSAKNCFKCAGSGFAFAPHGQSGKRILNDMDRLVARAKSEAQALSK
jgi:hypothetical protein